METRAELARRVTSCVSRGLRLGGAYLTLRVVDANVRETYGRFRSGPRCDARTRFTPNIHSRPRKKKRDFYGSAFSANQNVAFRHRGKTEVDVVHREVSHQRSADSHQICHNG